MQQLSHNNRIYLLLMPTAKYCWPVRCSSPRCTADRCPALWT